MSQLEVDKIIPQSGTTLTIGDSGDTITFGTGTTPQLGGNLDTNGNDINFGDNDKAQFGASNDLQIYHDGSRSIIQDNGTGNLRIQAENLELNNADNSENYIFCGHNGAVKLYYDNAEKLATTSTGVDVRTAISGAESKLRVSSDNTGDNDATVVISNGGTGDAMLRFDYEESNTDRARIGITSSGQHLQFFTAGNNERMRIDSSGNVGIGNSTPSSFVESSRFVVGSGTSGVNEMMFLYSGTNTFGALGFADGTSSTNRYRGMIGYDHNTDAMFISTAGGGSASRDVTVDSSGRVGIHTSTPSRDLQVVDTGDGNAVIAIKSSNDTYSSVFFGDTSADNIGKLTYDHTDNSLQTIVNNAERMRINSSGAVSIGSTANSGYKLKVDAQGDSLGAGYMLSDVYNQPSFEVTNTNTSNFGQSVLWLQCNRTTTNGSYNFLRVIQNGVTDKLFIRDSGNVVNANNSYGAISDLKLKEQITDASSQWSDIKNIQIKKFKFKHEVAEGDSDSLWKLGVIAQEIETVSPSLVETVKDTDKEGNAVLDDEGNETFTKNVKYSVLYMKAVKALQEAMQKIEDLEARVDTLEGN